MLLIRIIIVLITFLLLMCCRKEDQKIDYTFLLRKHVSDMAIQNAFNHLGKDYKYVEAYGMHYYGFENVGVEFNFSSEDTLRTIYFNEAIENLPYGLKFYFTRNDVEKLIGKPNIYKYGTNNFISYYLDKDMIIRYKNRDSISLDNPIRKILITKIDKEKLQ